MIDVVRITNPLTPAEGQVRHSLEHVQASTLPEYLRAVHALEEAGGEYEDWMAKFTVSVNGLVWTPELWSQVTPAAESCIVMTPKVGNGSTFRALGQLALVAASVALIASGVGAGLGAALAISTASANALLAGAVGIAGNLLISGISALLSSPPKGSSPSYGTDGPQASTKSGTPIAKGYGTIVWAGQVISSFVDVEGVDQYINLLCCFGFGPARAINNLQINGKDIRTFRNVQYYTRLGSNDQLPIQNFNRVVNGYPQQTQCLAGVPVVVPGTGDLTQILQVDVQFPGGVYFRTADGNMIQAVITYKVEYSLAGQNNWQPVLQPLTTSDVVSYDSTGKALIPHKWCVVATDMPPNSGVVYAMDDGPHNPGDPWTGQMTVTTYARNGNHSTYTKTFKGEWQLTNPDINQVLVKTWTDGYQDYVQDTSQTCYNRTTIYGLDPGKYDVRVTKWGSAKIHDDVYPGDNWSPNIGQDMWLHSVNEISLLDLNYPNMILVGIRALATSQLNGSSINPTAEITHGLRTLDNNILPAALQAFEEDNPACVCADMMLDPLYGGGRYPGIRPVNIERFIDEWERWAQLNDELIDSEGNGLVGWWKLNEGTGSIAIDSSGQGSNGSWTGDQTGTSGYYSAGQPWPLAGTFDGSTTYVSASAAALPTGSEARTLCGWVKTSNSPQQAFFGYGDDANGSAFALEVGVFSAGKVCFIGDNADVVGNATIADGAWHHLAVTYDGSLAVVYVDGVQDSSATLSLNTPTGLSMFIGRQFVQSGSSYHYTNGLISDVRMYNRALSAQEIAAVYNSPQIGNGGTAIRRHVFAGVFDTQTDLQHAMNSVGAMSRAVVLPIGRDYGVFVDAPDVPVQIFSVGNIVQDTFTKSWLELDARANQVEILIADKTRYYKKDNPIVYMDPANQNAGVPIKNVRVDGFGITDPIQAWHFARFRERSNQFLLRSGSFDCDVDAIASRPGNVVILQHDVPQWGWGGRTLPASTATTINLDRSDIATVAGKTYSMIVLRPAWKRYSGAVASVANITDSTGASTGTQLNVAFFDDANRVLRAVLTPSGGQPVDCKITSTAVGSVMIQPPPGFMPGAGMTCDLWDLDVLETATVQGIATANGLQVATLNTPLLGPPDDYSTYFLGESGTQKLVRITNIKQKSEFRRTIEWIDYDERCYIDGIPAVGETSAQITSNPGVTNLVAKEGFQLVSGSYATSVKLSWTPGPDTAGVAIYREVATPGLSISNQLPQMVARLTGYQTSYTLSAAVGTEVTYTVVGFDVNNAYQAFADAPAQTLTLVGVTQNLLLGSSFASGFTYWNLSTRAGDSMVPQFADDGQAVYTVNGTSLAAAQQIAFQVISPAKWAVGDYLMLSGYLEDSCASSSAPNAGQAVLGITFEDSSGNTISTTTAAATLNGVTPTLTRYNTAAVQIPAGTALVMVTVSVGGTGLSMPVGSTLTVSHLLLEIASAGQTTPSAWADIDVSGKVLDIFTNGASTSLRVQGSVLPSFSGAFSYSADGTDITLSWSNLVILWPDGLYTYVLDGSISVSGLTASTAYRAYLYYDIIYGGVKAATPSAPVGTPAILTTASGDAVADALCKQDNRVALTPGGMAISTTSGSTSTGTGGGSYGGNTSGSGTTYPGCTVAGTPLQTPSGPVDNRQLKAAFDAGEAVYLMGRDVPERVIAMDWIPAPELYEIAVEGMQPFRCSGSHTLLPEGGDPNRDYRWTEHLDTGRRVETLAGPRAFTRTRLSRPGLVLQIELEGPSHEYLVGEGVRSHNVKLPYGGLS